MIGRLDKFSSLQYKIPNELHVPKDKSPDIATPIRAISAEIPYSSGERTSVKKGRRKNPMNLLIAPPRP